MDAESCLNMMTSNSWCTIESDPAIFTELVRRWGVKGVQVEELYSMDQVTLPELQPVYGVIFLFKYVAGEVDDRPCVHSEDVYFANQVITNACATQALLMIVMNSPHIERGPVLSQFYEFTKSFPPEAKGLAISNSVEMCTAHNSFKVPDPIVLEHGFVDKEEDVFHFISYVPVNGILYELDGLRPGPIPLGECTEKDWLEKLKPVIQQRIQRYATNEIHFNLMVVIKNRKEMYQEELAKLEELKAKNEQGTHAMDVDTDNQPLDLKIAELKMKIEEEDQKLHDLRLENVQKTHNYYPAIMAMLKCMAKRGELPLTATATNTSM